MAFQYKAIDMNGRQVSDVLRNAASAADATEELRRRGLFVVEISEASDAPPEAGTGRWTDRFTAGRRLTRVAAFLRQMSVLLASGTPLVQTLGALERQAPDATFQEVIRQLRESVEEGEPLAMAMQSHPNYFDPVCRGLIAAGESGGNFHLILDRLANMVRQQCQTRAAVRSAMVYPSLLLAVSLGVVVLMIGFVLPRFEGMFDTMGAEMPLPTKVLLSISAWMTTHWWIVLLSLGGFVVASWKWLESAPGRRMLHTFVVRAPIIGPTVRAFCVARIARVLGMLLTSRVPLNESLQLTRDVAGNRHFASAITAAEESITRGGSLGLALGASGLFAPSVCEAINSGEQAGKLGELLTMVADYLDEENSAILKSATAMIEPVILIVVGLFVGIVVLSMFLPLFDIAASAGGEP
ncbi:MAG TPA: type II secretion system F family protein [Tepidisphaeraceae bacterium]|jgi:type IV pilus assembly protein PilC|nr:type II secretion system F family protein [Tepidisphaeraceae bacterium]